MHSPLHAFPRAPTQWTLMTSLGPFWFHQMNKNKNKQLSYFNLKKKKKEIHEAYFNLEKYLAQRGGNRLYHGWQKAHLLMHHFLTFNLHNLSLIIWQLSEDFGSRIKEGRNLISSKIKSENVGGTKLKLG